MEKQQNTELQDALLDQLAYLVHEVEALRAIVARVPEAVLEGRPYEGERSIKEMYGILAAADTAVFLPRLRRMVAADLPAFEPADDEALRTQEAWNDHAMDALLDRIRAGRTELLDFLRSLPPAAWDRQVDAGAERRTVYTFAHHIIQHDAELLRAVGYRLHESHLTERAEDLPK